MKKQLQFRQDGTFKIVQFTDLHWENGDQLDADTNRLMERILIEEKPDLVVFTGDIIYSPASNNPIAAFRGALEPVGKMNIPWAAVFGNHDTEGNVSKEELLAVMQEYPNSLTEVGVVSGAGNYVVPVLDSSGAEVEWALFFLDSGMDNANKLVGGYDFIKRDQIDWYVKESLALKENGGPAELLFFHIPLPEYKEVWEHGNCVGSMKEGEICSPAVNSGLFSAMVEMGTAKGTFVGHDHLNDFCGELHGIQLCYGRATGYNGYGQDDFPRGARIIQLQEGKRNFDTYLRLADGSKVVQENSASNAKV
ncbi:metallophosphoesterase family protein [Neobacillus niacini]|uniref:metallophosphoesterase family protein n=1 Tax=Neobacillus niacini TaxID=86668 RepID=UPI0007ABDC50|nr:metallophosphoesterase family protein [Neobacillus niacini]MEC1524499.1 metallophosphoesterase family protein [Neobacillus niacini]